MTAAFSSSSSPSFSSQTRSQRGKEATERNHQGLELSRLTASCGQLAGDNDRLKGEAEDARMSALQALESVRI